MDKRQQTLEIIAEVTDRAREEIEADMDLTADLGIDSPKALFLLLRLEDEVGVEIGEEEAAAMETVGDILDRVAPG